MEEIVSHISQQAVVDPAEMIELEGIDMTL